MSSLKLSLAQTIVWLSAAPSLASTYSARQRIDSLRPFDPTIWPPPLHSPANFWKGPPARASDWAAARTIAAARPNAFRGGARSENGVADMVGLLCLSNRSSGGAGLALRPNRERNVTTGLRIRRSAASVTSMASALSQPNRRSAGRSVGVVRPTADQRQVVCVRHSLPRPKRLSGHERPPLAERGRAFLLVNFAGDEMTFLVEMVVDLSMN